MFYAYATITLVIILALLGLVLMVASSLGESLSRIEAMLKTQELYAHKINQDIHGLECQMRSIAEDVKPKRGSDFHHY
jgi:cytochrome c-type biogenesis protein CcmH/NrfF